MRFKSLINLIKVSIQSDDIGNQLEVINKRQVFAEKKSVRQSEFYNAASLGLKPELVFVTWTKLYEGESKLEYDGKTYSIIRTFDSRGGKIELYCEVKSSD